MRIIDSEAVLMLAEDGQSMFDRNYSGRTVTIRGVRDDPGKERPYYVWHESDGLRFGIFVRECELKDLPE